MDIIKRLNDELNINEKNLQAAINLMDEGNTIPFIARYRKEVTGNLTDADLRKLEERLAYLRNLDERINTVLKSIEEQGKLTEVSSFKIASASGIKPFSLAMLPLVFFLGLYGLYKSSS